MEDKKKYIRCRIIDIFLKEYKHGDRPSTISEVLNLLPAKDIDIVSSEIGYARGVFGNLMIMRDRGLIP